MEEPLVERPTETTWEQARAIMMSQPVVPTPSVAIAGLRLNAKTMRLLSVLCWLEVNNRFMRTPELAKAVGRCTASVVTALRRMETGGWLIVRPLTGSGYGKGKPPKFYHLNIAAMARCESPFPDKAAEATVSVLVPSRENDEKIAAGHVGNPLGEHKARTIRLSSNDEKCEW
jgi:hypothetical protein